MSTISEEDSLIEFPCDFPIKIMGKAEDDFETLAYEIVSQYCADLSRSAVKSRPSRTGKYLAVTITIRAENKAQLDNIYQALTAHERVSMAL